MIHAFDTFIPQLLSDRIFVADSASVIGHVTLGDHASIWFGAVLRGDIEPIDIGAGTNIQDNSVVHTRRHFPVNVGQGTTVGHQVTLHGCTVGNSCLIGMKATLLDGAIVGDNCLIGAGSLVKENQQIPSGSLALGFPARVIRKLTPEEITSIQATSTRYIELQHKYRKSQ